ncbi:MAG: hypothetical protein A2284_08120 [Deltaproteobacteria bacterium RIFOXYA12_FULL_61_11]|nr:MAG: hypothetical protein A2284_08120 [Deltaproteobacteria bacterium RIFOXYA12_FULL_61_11]
MAVNIFDYDDYRVFLRDRFDELKKEKSQFSFRFFARKAGLAAWNFPSLVIKGKRNLSKESVYKFSTALGLQPKEHEYFENLVFLNQADTIKEKNHYYLKLNKVRGPSKIKRLLELEFSYYSEWYIPVLREMVELAGLPEDPERIAKLLDPPITRREVERGFSVLEELGLIEYVEGRRVKKDRTLTTDSEARSLLIKNFHHRMISLGLEALDRFQPDERNISSLTLSITDEQFEEVKRRTYEFMQEILALVTNEKRTDRIYQCNFQLFPLTRSIHTHED